MKLGVCSLLCVLCLVLWTCDSTSAMACSNPPPGVAKMIRGVDITELDLDPIDVIGSSGFKSPVLNFTCNNQDRKWTNAQGVEYELPDQVWSMTSVPGGWLSADVSIFKSYQEVRNSLGVTVGAEGMIKKFAFSVSGSYSRMQHTIVSTNRFISDVGSFDGATRVDFNPTWVLQLDQYAQVFVDTMLTGTFQSNPETYREFIEEFGTHYFASAQFGGYIRVLHETQTSYFYSRTDTEVEANAKASYLHIISVNGGVVTSNTNVDETFLSESSLTVKYYGGDTNLLVSNGIQAWQPTVDGDPWLFTGELKLISELISDSTKKASMVEAVEDHLKRRYLDELLRLIAAARLRSSDHATLNSLETLVNNKKAQTTLTEAEVDQLAAQVEEYLKAPRCENVELASHGFEYGERTMAFTVGSITLNRKDSNSACTLGSSFGIKSSDSTKVWVNTGCRGNFIVCSVPESNPPPFCIEAELESNGFQYSDKMMEFFVTSITLLRRDSNSACTLNTSYGSNLQTIWVDRGCRGNFRICS